MLNRNQAIITIFALSILGYTQAFAANSPAIFTDSPTASTNAAPMHISHTSTCSCKKPLWTVGVQALYLKPSFGGNGLGYSSFSNYGNDIPGNLVDVNGATNYISNMNPQRSWGFRLEGDYSLDGINDLNINWGHFNETTTGHLPLGTLFAGSAGGLYAGYIRVAPSWDAINAEAGHRFVFDTNKALRLHVGVAFARIKNKFTNYPQLYRTGNPLFVTTDTLSYKGFGPRFGGDFDYSFGCGWGVYAKGAGSLLVGSAKQSAHGYYDFTFLTNTFPYSTGNYSQSHSNVVVPEVEAKLGLTYEHAFAQGKLGFDLGYLWMAYLNAVVSQVGADVYSSAISSSTTTNFDLNGLYFGIKWTGNA
jgi:hypothetical protein